MNTDVKCSIKEASSNELLYQIEVHNGLIRAYIVKKHDGPIPYIHTSSFHISCLRFCAFRILRVKFICGAWVNRMGMNCLDNFTLNSLSGQDLRLFH